MIVRVERRLRFTCVDNHALEDARLSFRALGLLVYLLSKSSDWSVHIKQLTETHVEGREAVRHAMQELEVAGYAQRRKGNDPDTGQLRWECVIYEQPIAQESDTDAQEPDVGLPDAQEPAPTKEGSTKDGITKAHYVRDGAPVSVVPYLDALGSDARGQRLPTFVLSPAMYEWAAENTPDVDVRAASAVFADYWRGVSGQKARKADWLATWRNWMRRANNETRTNGRARAPTKTEAVLLSHPETARILKENL